MNRQVNWQIVNDISKNFTCFIYHDKVGNLDKEANEDWPRDKKEFKRPNFPSLMY